MVCEGPCGRPMVPYTFVGPLPLGWGRKHARGHCGACYQWERRQGLDRRTLRRETVVEETEFLAGQGFYGAQIAERLGISWDAVRLAHRRAGAVVPVLKNPDSWKYYREDVSRGTTTVRPRVAA